MKMQKLLPKVYVLGFILFVISCSTDETSDPDPIPNNIPVMTNQEFDVPEDLGKLKTIGILEATDADNDNLTFQLESDIDLLVNSSTGEIKTTANSILDYENETTLNFNVSIKDNKGGKKTATITINVLDVDDGPLTNLQKSFINEYVYLTYKLSPTSSGGSLSEKWQNEVKLFIEGNITTAYQQMIESFLEEFNALITDNTTLTLVSSLEESNVHLILGAQSSIQQIWPDMFNLVSDSNLQGYALYNANANNHIIEGRIWVNNTNKGIFIHELGHILGLGHTSNQYCDNGGRSFMCSAPAPEFNTFDVEIIKALYHSGTSVGLTQTEMRMLIEEYIIENSILQ
ncbi:cadherin domain-containing protein [Arenibacter sp. F26102]|uniref:cadherin domain-containing protein n=1 Tax=Arenibacter sp. F26102 TaxID=2926416 RepID=UPI001FF1C766|nr:cadherin domain-containing protein [Arenibacter sp. F26102]MCK0144740.1 cadherin domain-containing protein [Arenibacter sp. F26102]